MQNSGHIQEILASGYPRLVSISDSLTEINRKIENEIKQGKTSIMEQQANKIKLDNKRKKNLSLLNLSQRRSIDKLEDQRKSQKAISMSSSRQYTDISQRQLEQHMLKNIDSTQRLKELKKMRDVAIQRKKQNERKKQEKLDAEKEKKETEERELIKKLKEEKLKSIQQKIRQFQTNKKQRMNRIQQSIIRSTPNLPKFKQMQADFENQEERRQSQRNKQVKKNIRQKFAEFDSLSIRSHEKKYIERIKSRFNAQRAKTEEISEEKKEEGFRMGKNKDEISQAKAKVEKMKKYGQESKKIKFNVNTQKNMELLIAKDKAKNPMKYYFLQQKNLNDYQIYNDYKNFNLEVDGKLLGNSYLNSIAKQNRQKMQKAGSSRLATVSPNPEPERKEYKNYLEDSRKQAKKFKEVDQMEQLFRLYGDKSKVLQVLQDRSEYQKSQALKKIGNMQRMRTYGESVEMEREIDADYIESIRSKLLCVSIK